MLKQEKVKVIEEFVGVFKEPGFYLMDFKGLNVAQITELRSALREARVSMQVVKNTLALRALAEAGITGIDSYFAGPTGIIWSAEDAITPVKVLSEFLKKYDKGSIKAGMVEGTLVTATDMDRLVKLPGKKELYAKVASALSSPLSKLAWSLNAVPSKMVQTIEALRVKRESEAA
jgi:large subunit ribosomal protein L10